MSGIKQLNDFFSERLLRVRAQIKTEVPANQQFYRPHLGVETGGGLYRSIFDAIKRGDHVLLIGPRGCGKSYAARTAIRLGETEPVGSEGETVLVPGAQLLIQGNKEFPRDYFFEPEFEFLRKQGGAGVGIQLRQPPLFLHARQDQNSGQLKLDPVKIEDSDRADHITHYRAYFETDEGQEISKFVLFLDEINRFNDGLLDSLLLLLEEGLVLYQGKTVKVPAVIVATMNPPGYDVTARPLSPPLLSRFNSVMHLYTAGLKTMTETILPSEVETEYSNTDATVMKEDILRFSAASLAFWGTFQSTRPCAIYLSPETASFLEKLYESGPPLFKDDMDFVCSVSNYGPDARAARDWILASKRYTDQHHHASLSEAAERTMAAAVANKLVLNFNPEAKPERMNQLLCALSRITRQVFEETWAEDCFSYYSNQPN